MKALCCIFIILGMSCVSHRGFFLYKESPDYIDKLNIRGIYINEKIDYSLYDYFVFYEDGTFGFGGIKIHPSLILNDSTTYEREYQPELFTIKGHYRVIGQMLYLDSFCTEVGTLSTKVNSFICSIAGDEINVSYSVFCGNKRKKTQFSDQYNGTYKFYRTNFKPQKKLWIKNRKWYQKNVWYNQKSK